MPAPLTTRHMLRRSWRARSRLIHEYCSVNKDRYATFARTITPRYDEWEQIWTRAAFAILSANAPFDRAVKTLQYATTCKGKADRFLIMADGHTGTKADYLNALPCGPAIFELLRGINEPWDHYRERLRKTVRGVARAKGSFLAALLYPCEADVACIDTHMQKTYLGIPAFRAMRRDEYLTVEAKVRRVARRHNVSTFLAQWMIWDCTRGSETSHDIFPGKHHE